MGRTGPNCEFTPCPASPSANNSDGTTNWKTYESAIFSIKYPANWVAKTDLSVSDREEIYDPSSMRNSTGNGGGANASPIRYVNIAIISSAETEKQYVDEMTTNNPAYNGVKIARRSIVINGLPAEIFNESGEGSKGYDTVLSNGKQLLVMNIPISDPNTDLVINQMLSSFKFVK